MHAGFDGGAQLLQEEVVHCIAGCAQQTSLTCTSDGLGTESGSWAVQQQRVTVWCLS